MATQRKKPDVSYLDQWMPKYAPNILAKTGLRVVDPEGGIGCGTFGCVYKTSDPRWVVKVTRDKHEVPLALTIVELRKKYGGGSGYGPSKVLPGIVFFKDLFAAKEVVHRGERFRPYVLVRENVEPVSERFVGSMERYIGPPFRKDHTALTLSWKYARKFYESGHDLRSAVRAFDRYIESVDFVEQELPLVGHAMLAMVKEKKILFEDVHPHNIGFSTVNWGKRFRPVGTPVIFDLGVSESRPSMQPRMINPVHIPAL